MSKKLLLFLGVLCLFATSYAQSISSLTPNSTQQGQSLTITIVGQNTTFNAGVTSVKLIYGAGSGTFYTAASVTVASDTTLDAGFAIPAYAATGFYRVEVYSNNTLISKLNSFEILSSAPSIASISPSTSTVNNTLTVSIVGANTSFQSGGVSSIKLLYGNGSPTTYIGSNIQITSETEASASFTIPSNAPLGFYNLEVNTNSQLLTKSNSFEVIYPNAPQISSVSPSSSGRNQSLSVSLVGLNTSFQIGGVASVQLKYSSGSSTTYVGTNIVVNSNTSLTADFTIPIDAPFGYYQVEVNSNSEIITKSNAFQVTSQNNSALSSISPSSSERNNTLNVTIVGLNTDFQSGVSNVQLIYNSGSPTIYTGSNIVINSNTSVTATFSIPANAPLGYYDVALNNNGTPLMKYSSFLITAVVESIKSVSKTVATKGESFVLTVIGKNTSFTSGVSNVEYSFQNGYLLNNPTHFSGTNISVIDDTTLTAEFTIPADAFLGDYQLTLSGYTTLQKNSALLVDASGNVISGTVTDLVEGDIIYLIDNNNDTIATDTLNANLYFEFIQVPNGQYTMKIKGIANGSVPVFVNDDDNNALALTTSGGSFDILTSIQKPTTNEALGVYPNPAVSQLTIVIPTTQHLSYIYIYNSIGEEVMNYPYNSGSGSKFTLNVSEWSAGMYFVNYINGSTPVTTSFVVVK